MNISFVDLKAQYKNLKQELDMAVLVIMENGTFIMGKPVETFEKAISDYLGESSLGCASGSDALLLTLMTSGVGQGDEVITSPFTFFATAGAVSRLGAKPVFVDIDEKTFNIGASQIKSAITKKTKAVIPVHIFGQPADMDGIMKVAKEKNLKVIEDTCQAIGSEYKGKKAGTIGDFGCFSFFPTKNLGGAGDGGLITCKVPEDYQKVKMLRVHGAKIKYHHDLIGINSRLDAIQAAVLSVKLKYLDSWNKCRGEIAKIYDRELVGVVKTPYVSLDVKHIYHQYAIRTEKRDALLKHLNDSGVSAGIYYPVPLHLQKCFVDLGYKKGNLPVAEKLCEEVLSLPIYPELEASQIDFVVKTVKEFFNR